MRKRPGLWVEPKGERSETVIPGERNRLGEGESNSSEIPNVLCSSNWKMGLCARFRMATFFNKLGWGHTFYSSQRVKNWSFNPEARMEYEVIFLGLDGPPSWP